jgi:putative endonuclease
LCHYGLDPPSKGNRMKKGFMYIMSNKQDGVLYIGVTSDIVKRVYEHKNNFVDGFTKLYNLKNLVYYEVYDDIEEAIKREKQLKNWHRDWKIELVNKQNPQWNDLYESIL